MSLRKTEDSLGLKMEMSEKTIFYEKRKQEIVKYLKKIIPIREHWVRKNKYYYDLLLNFLKFNIQENSKVLQIKIDTGFFLNKINSIYSLGIEEDQEFIRHLKRAYPHNNFEYGIPEDIKIDKKFDYVLSINSIGLIVDVKKFFDQLHKVIDDNSRIIIVYYSKLWEYILKFAEHIGFKIKTPEQNWLSNDDIENLLNLSGFEIVKKHSLILMPIPIPIISGLLNSLSKLPFINKLCFIQSVIARRIPENKPRAFSCSVVVPCRNEEGNIVEIVKRIPQLGSHTELIFVDDKSTDNTRRCIEQVIADYPQMDIKLIDGPGIGKAQAVWRGFKAAGGEILFILDADLAVPPEELIHFYSIMVSGKAEFVNGSRLIYPMQGRAMHIFNLIGNKFFSFLFSYILGQKIKDTLCGTKVLFRNDFKKMQKFIGTWGIKDRWGDYELLFGASRINLKIVDFPVHYCQRHSGFSKMTGRLKNGIIMLSMCLAAYKKIKF